MTLRTATDIWSYLELPNVQAFLLLIRKTESSLTDDAYRMVNGGPKFTDFSDHPYAGLSTHLGGHAAGAYQFLPSTWAGVKKQYNLPDFSPRNQDFAACVLLNYRGALDDVAEGQFYTAIEKCKQEWTSLPGAAESYAVWTRELALEFYLLHGGKVGPQPDLINESAGDATSDMAVMADPAPPSPKGSPMGILEVISLFGPMIANLIPQVGKLFGSGTEVSNRNLGAAQIVVDTITKATGAFNVQDALLKMKADPTLLNTVTQAVVTEPTIMGIIEVNNGGINKARSDSLEMQNAVKPFWYNPAFWITMIFFLPPLDFVIYTTMTNADFSKEVKAQVVTGVLTVLTLVGAFWLGSSWGGQKKDEAKAATDAVAVSK